MANDTDRGLGAGNPHESRQVQGIAPDVSAIQTATENDSTVTALPVELPSVSPGHGQRPARALLGWMPPGQGELAMVSNQMGVPLTPDQHARLEEARAAVAGRARTLDQRGVVTDLPSELTRYVGRLQATTGAQMVIEGWEVALVDLARVIAFQPTVFTDTTAERVANVDVSSVEALAEYTLPVVHVPQVTMQRSESQNIVIFSSPNPNLKVLGNFQGPVPQANGMPGCGFFVAEALSFMQVIEVEGRYYLRDGYHRAFSLISRGVTRVPAFVRRFAHLNGLVPDGMLPPEAWMGERPPLLTDYHDDTVAETVYLPAAQKVIVIQALELGLAS